MKKSVLCIIFIMILVSCRNIGDTSLNTSDNVNQSNFSVSEIGGCKLEGETDSDIKAQVLCLIDKGMYSEVGEVIVSHNKQDDKVFSTLASYAFLYLMEGSNDIFREEWEKVSDKLREVYYDDNELTDASYDKLREDLTEFLDTRTTRQMKKESKEEGFFDPEIGMKAEELLESKSWGKPKDINKTTTEYGVHEQWVYSGGRYVYLEDGVVTSIQE
ncbi:hypothetical protein [Paenibacillus aquistagni]|uniref:Uncharacterized protein n=1 Tax=Paenibacillus aquistagni TaxID=1852522 RepID=A0A1X7LET8_9BACL|nr:hypothetical protein [Paenibacillus aquistagni]SMG52200.1 hypothetical protein SAMN06295960_3362 [Paenibacillus aquistagni]